MNVDTGLPAWQVVLALLGFASMWGAAMYRLNSHSKQHQKHFEHAANLSLHQTQRDREDVDRRFSQIETSMKDIKQGQDRINDSILQLAKEIGRLER